MSKSTYGLLPIHRTSGDKRERETNEGYDRNGINLLFIS
jgi:hypothetical protein